ncbi:hypothetical protein M9H77_36953 [Catharanthus roseus]|uniref:Uncharacterized protein n=1 Tax=Catharanthus roseus TaxID=4058 RepID=A0ACB9ZV79_CATRO|nr:hypothetical protein M9H77_36953 [Catharanthus roseus]
MKTCLFFILAIVLVQCKCSSADLISTTCDQTPNDNLCISTLKRDPRSRKADVAGLGLIMIDAVKIKATSALDQITKIQKSNSLLKNSLMECSENYNLILKSDIPKSIRSFRENPKLAENGMAASAVEAQGCENSLRGSKISPDFTQLNQSVYELSNIARAIIRAIRDRRL